MRKQIQEFSLTFIFTNIELLREINRQGWSGNNIKNLQNADKIGILGGLFFACGTILVLLF